MNSLCTISSVFSYDFWSLVYFRIICKALWNFTRDKLESASRGIMPWRTSQAAGFPCLTRNRLYVVKTLSVVLGKNVSYHHML